MRSTIGGLAAVTMIFLAGAAHLEGQNRRGPGMRGPDGGMNAERVMAMRDRLELTEGQIAQLDELRAEQVAERTAMQARMQEVRSRIAAGEADRTEMQALMEEMREGMTERREAQRSRLEAILTEDQRTRLQELRDRRGPGRRGGPAMRRGARGPRIAARGPDMRGPRFRARAWGGRGQAGWGPRRPMRPRWR